jgi:hypothetical protein
MPTPSISDLLKYSNLQMAAEAFLYDESLQRMKAGQELLDALLLGNKHASRFTSQLADQFLDPDTGWTVVVRQRGQSHLTF